ncbi:hypothetical protein PHLGIDRAFT_378746 [Phlebiopsis gigantea 11061_1 CR5-6]|uniref:F-box domain-containing protein n=1 Tax=Phlebiopsis gigantea (strain 11061_1 CR5-6) TaxID=745531 RepID=A0A0C3S0M7_PHLG1|nr:hypothetical protein PHLGIDRAFT_378746 [Phlebiopsis gigantea 11061_1 CR5-6]
MSSKQHPTSLPDLPVEISLLLFQAMKADGFIDSHHLHRHYLSSCSCVCKFWAREIREAIFRRIAIRSHKDFQRLAHILSTSPSASRYVGAFLRLLFVPATTQIVYVCVGSTRRHVFYYLYPDRIEKERDERGETGEEDICFIFFYGTKRREPKTPLESRERGGERERDKLTGGCAALIGRRATQVN